MKFNEYYKASENKKLTVKAINAINKFILEKLKTKIDLFEIDLPAFNRIDSDILINHEDITRRINFDFGDEYQVATLFLDHSNLMRKKVNEIDLVTDEGLYGKSSTIWRDEVQSPISSVHHSELIITYVAKDKKETFAKANELMKSIFTECSQMIEDKYSITNYYDGYVEVIEAQMLENEMPKISSFEREKNILETSNMFILSESGSRLFSGKFHNPNISPLIYELTRHNALIVKDTNYDVPLKVAEVGIMASGQVLKDQIKKYKLEDFENLPFYKELIKSKKILVQIKFNLPQIYMAILQKGHIAEVQYDVLSDESEVLSAKKRIDNL